MSFSKEIVTIKERTDRIGKHKTANLEIKI
jgi:hypothetical protein